ncbi:MAG: hypothetical protein JKY56_10425 [Kofleriaceae bacterium]|nr:hypothetical protein [Kofleriaceae bacterium]
MENITTTISLRKLRSLKSSALFGLSTLLLLGANSLAAGCGSSSSDDENSSGRLDVRVTNPVQNLGGPFEYYAYFDLISDDLEDQVNYDANFLQMVDSQPASVFALSVPPAIDKCNLRITETIPTDASVIGFPKAQFNLVSAGDTFTLNGESGVYTSIVRSESRFEIGPYPIPEPLTLDIPGDEFPMIKGIPVPNVPQITNFMPIARADVGANTPITWTPSGVAGNSVYVHIFDFPRSDRVVDLRCRMADDGSFALSDNPDIVDALNAALGDGFTLTGLTLKRRAFTVRAEGSTLIVVGKERRRQ